MEWCEAPGGRCKQPFVTGQGMYARSLLSPRGIRHPHSQSSGTAAHMNNKEVTITPRSFKLISETGCSIVAVNINICLISVNN